MATQTRQRIIAAASELTGDGGWAAITMSRLARRAGVSRQTVYNEIGSKGDLAEAVVLHELAGFIALVDAAFAATDDLVDALYNAAYAVFSQAEDNVVVRAVLSSTQGHSSELLPLVTTQADAVFTATRETVVAKLQPHAAALTPAQLAAVVDMTVRVVISHVLRPGRSHEDSAHEVAWLVARTMGVRYHRPSALTG